jgi:hypothetical protein
MMKRSTVIKLIILMIVVISIGITKVYYTKNNKSDIQYSTEDFQNPDFILTKAFVTSTETQEIHVNNLYIKGNSLKLELSGDNEKITKDDIKLIIDNDQEEVKFFSQEIGMKEQHWEGVYQTNGNFREPLNLKLRINNKYTVNLDLNKAR